MASWMRLVQREIKFEAEPWEAIENFASKKVARSVDRITRMMPLIDNLLITIREIITAHEGEHDYEWSWPESRTGPYYGILESLDVTE